MNAIYSLKKTSLYTLAHPFRLIPRGDEADFAVSLEPEQLGVLVEQSLCLWTGLIFFRKLAAFKHLLSPGQVTRLTKLQEHYLRQAALYLFLKTEAQKIGPALQAAGIGFLFIKGISTIDRFYPRGMLRDMQDIDILIHEGDLERAEAVLTELGYRLDNPGYRRMNRLYSKELHYIRELPENNIRFSCDLHWAVVSPSLVFLNNRMPQSAHCFRDYDVHGMFAEREFVTIDGQQFETLSRVNAFLTLCWDLTIRNRFVKLTTYTDMFLMLQSVEAPEPFWESIIEKAWRSKTRTAVALALRLFQEIMDCPVPPAVITRLKVNPGQWWKFSRLIHFADNRCFHWYFRFPYLVPYLTRNFFLASPLNRWISLVKDLRYLVVPPRPHLEIRYQDENRKKTMPSLLLAYYLDLARVITSRFKAFLDRFRR